VFLKLPASENNHGIRFHDSVDSADSLNALIYFHHAHAADDGYDVVLARDLVQCFNSWNLTYPVGDILSWARRSCGEQCNSFSALGNTDFDCEFSYYTSVGEVFNSFSNSALGQSDLRPDFAISCPPVILENTKDFPVGFIHLGFAVVRVIAVEI